MACKPYILGQASRQQINQYVLRRKIIQGRRIKYTKCEGLFGP